MMKSFIGITVAAAASFATAQATYTFDTDTEGWGTFNDAQDFEWDGAIGNPGGAIRARDGRTGAIWYYEAPDNEYGDRSSLLGGEISWDILGITGSQTSVTGRADIILRGEAGVIGLILPVQPVNDQWTSWSALLDASAGWETVASLSNGTLTGNAVSNDEISEVLGSLFGLYIRGEYTNGSDASALDNVNIVPVPGAAAAFGLCGLMAAHRRRR